MTSERGTIRALLALAVLAITYVPLASPARCQENIYAKMRRAMTAARYHNPRTVEAMASPPSISVTGSSRAPSGLNDAFSPETKPGVLTALGGPKIYTRQGPNKKPLYFNIQTNKKPNGAFDTLNFRWEAVVDSSRLAVHLYGTGAPVRFLVDGRYVDLRGTVIPVGEFYVEIDFRCSGGRALRTIDVEASSYYFGFGGFYVGATEGVYKSAGSPLRVIFLGDSYFAGAGTANLNDGLPAVMGDYMGTPDEWSEGQGGTGFLQVGSSWPYRSHLSDITDNQPDFAIIGSASNDQFTATPAQVTTEVGALITAVRRVPSTATTPLFFLGAWPNQYGVTATNMAMDLAVGRAVKEAQAAGDANVFWIPCVADPNGVWVTGTGNTAHLKGDGNLDVYGATDGVHLNSAGWKFVGQRFVDQILSAIRNK